MKRGQTGRWVLAEEIRTETGGSVYKFLPTPRVESKVELEDYLTQKAQDYAGRKVFVTYQNHLRLPED